MRQYNKDNIEKYGVDFSILTDSRDYFMCHLDVHQGKKKSKIYINPCVKYLLTIQKLVAKSFLNLGIDDDTNSCKQLFIVNRCGMPQLFMLIFNNYNMRGIESCRVNLT